jgi:pyrroline-5-carboxylate reductase
MAATLGSKVGFLGGGVMAEAICRGILACRAVPPTSIYMYEIFAPRRMALEAMNLGITICDDVQQMVTNADIVVLATKPDVASSALDSCAAHWTDEKLLVSICAGITLDTLTRSMFPRASSLRAVRAMPNTPCLVGEAATAFCANSWCTDDDRAKTFALLSTVGEAVELPEKLMDAVTGLSGSGPGYVFMFIEALSDAGVRQGIPRYIARKLAARVVYGSAKMVLEDPETHPGEFRNRVESPGGTTIAGTMALESAGFRSAVVDAVAAATTRAKELGTGK